MISFLFVILALAAFGWAFYRFIQSDTTSPVVERPLVLSGAALLGLAWLATGIVTIGAGEVGIVTRFGAVTGREMEPGVNVKAPFPIEQVTRFDTRVQKNEVDASAASADLQDVKSKLALNYHVERGKVSEIYRQIGTNYDDKIIAPAMQETFKATSAKFTARELITKRAEVKADTTATLSERLKPYGIAVDSVSLINFEFSPEFSRAIEQSQVAQQQVEKANNDLKRIQVEAEQKISQARAEAEGQRLQRETINDQVIRLREIDAQRAAIEKWSGQMPTTVLGNGSNTLFNIPVGGR